MRESKAAMRKAEKDAERARREENKGIKRYNRAIDKLSCLMQKEWESPKAYGSRVMKLLNKVDDDDERWVVKKFIKGIDRKEFRRTIRAERDHNKMMTLAAAIDKLKNLYEQADDTDYDSDSDSDDDDDKQMASIRIYTRSDTSRLWTANSDSTDVDEEQLLYLLRDYRSNAIQPSSADPNDDMNMNSELPPVIDQTICRNTDNAGIDPEVPIGPYDSSNLELEKGLEVESREAMETAGGMAITAGDLEDRCKQEFISVRLPAYRFLNSAQPIFELLPRRTEGPAADNWLETTTVSGNAWDFRGKPIVRLPIRQIENQPPGQAHMMDNDYVATESIERLAKRTTKPLATPDGHLVLQSEQIWLDLDRYRVLVQAAATEKNIATVEQTLPFARTLSDWDPGWKQVGEYLGHGRATAGGVLEHQGNGEEPGVETGEELGDEQGEAQKLQVTKEEVGGMPGEETSGAKIAGEGGKVANPEAEGATPESLHDNPGDTENHEWDPGLGTARMSGCTASTARKEMVLGCHLRSQPEMAGEKKGFEDKNANIIPLFAWPPDRAILGRYQVSDEPVERLNLQLQRQYSSPGNPSGEGKSPRKRAQYTMRLQGEQPYQAAAASGFNQGLGAAGAPSRRRTPVKNNPPYNPVETSRVIIHGARAGSGNEIDIRRNQRKPLNEWPRVKRWLHTSRAFSWRVEVELQRESGATGGMEWLGRRLWDPGDRQTQRAACGVTSIREMGRSVGL